jgi:DUF4097 and DUF4098 domain-containing protein YvlB
MASQPPTPPPGQPYGGPPFGGDPRDYWRFQKEQRKAAWRAQRAQWKAQQDILRAQRRANRVPSIAGPILLIGVGIIFLLVMTGRLDGEFVWNWYKHWWPVLLIGLGLVALAEWALDMRRDQPRMRGFGGYVALVILLAILGATGSGFDHFWGSIRDNMGDDGNDFFSALGQPEHDQDQPVLNSTVPANAQVEIQNPHGDISISAADGNQISVTAHQVAYASDDREANKIFDSQKAQVTVTGDAVLVKVDGNSNGKTNLVVTVPRTASVNVNSGRGGVTIAGLAGNVDATVEHGDLETTAIEGHVHAHLSHDGDFSAHDVKGDLSVDGSGGDLTLTDLHGAVTVQGDYSNVHVERADQPLHFHSSRTDMELARLPGDLSLSLESLHATEIVGPVRVTTHSKDIELNQVYGETHIEDRDGRVELGLAGSYPAEVKNEKGDVDITLPPGAAVTVDGTTNNGDIVSDFPLQISGDDDKRVTGNIGRGGPKLLLSTEHADLHIRRGTESISPTPPSISTPPKVGAAPQPPAPPGVPHLKVSRGESSKPISQ